MYHIDFNKPNHVHFIGIGGISMSGLAEILLERGFTVSGSDAHESELTKMLERNGAQVFYGQKAENIIEGIDVVVYTAAIHPDNPEYMAAEAKGIPMLSRADFLGQIMRNYKNSIAVAGTHGKTTTTSMVTQILMDAKADPTVTVGGMLDVIGGNIRVGGDKLFVMEACEYTNSFLSFFPTIEVILNIEADHLDFFKDLDDIRNSFREFAKLLDAHWKLSQQVDAGSTNTLIDQIFLSIDDLIDGRMICGAGGGGFLQVIMKKGVTTRQLHQRLKNVFQDNAVDVWPCKLVF